MVQSRGSGRRLLRSVSIVPIVLGVLGAATDGPNPVASSAIAQATPAAQFPAPPANGEIGWIVDGFTYSVVQEKAACPDGLATRNREIFLSSLSAAERERLSLPANATEYNQRFIASLMGPNGTNVCSNPDMFERPLHKTVQSKLAWGLDLDGDASGGPKDPDTCEHESFTSPAGDRGIDNQGYRAQGCSQEWRGVDGIAGDIVRASKDQMTGGIYTQAILLRGVDSWVRDDDVTVIYGNTPDRPVVDSTGAFIPGSSFTLSATSPRHRNVLRGRILNGVLTTEPQTIRLAANYGNGAGGNVMGVRGKYDLQKGRLRLAIQPDGSLKGLVGGYQPPINFILVHTLGGIGTAFVAGIDCSSELKTLEKYADGIKDPKTGKCTAVSTAMDLHAIPAFVNDAPTAPRIASK